MGSVQPVGNNKIHAILFLPCVERCLLTFNESRYGKVWIKTSSSTRLILVIVTHVPLYSPLNQPLKPAAPLAVRPISTEHLANFHGKNRHICSIFPQAPRVPFLSSTEMARDRNYGDRGTAVSMVATPPSDLPATLIGNVKINNCNRRCGLTISTPAYSSSTLRSKMEIAAFGLAPWSAPPRTCPSRKSAK